MSRPWLPRAGAWVLLLGLVACSGVPERPRATPPPTVVPPPVSTTPPPPQLRYEPAAWNNLPGWRADDPRAAWPALLLSCRTPRLAQPWGDFCRAAQAVNLQDAAAQRRLIESRLKPWRLTSVAQDGSNERRDTGMITGYYEPVIKGARQRGGVFQTPLYAVPDDLVTIDLGEMYPALKGERVRGRLQGKRVTPYPDRAALSDGKLLAGKEIVWAESAYEAFFLQIQGSGRVTLPDGSAIRLAFADVNGQPYRSIGRYLVEKGELTLEEASGPGLKRWLNTHPERLVEVLNSNSSVVFFREEKIVDPKEGPRGALGLPLTAGRSIAIDPRLLPLGAPMFIASKHPITGAPLERLVLAQDTGGAIRGAIRADFFWGLGQEAGTIAGSMRHDGALWLLWPADQPPPEPAIP
jgi:membrane-bound lytic murein transglycosylase A